MKNYTYGIYRIGSNSYNQSMTHRCIVCSVEATSRENAIKEALNSDQFSLYANQHLEAIPWSKVSRADAEELAFMDSHPGTVR